jgi:5'-3' exonuclease
MSLILIDTSYTSFYRFFATLRWYSFNNPDEYKLKNNNNYDWSTDTVFIEKYEKMYLNSIIKLLGSIIFDDSEIIFCMDSPKNLLWRIDIKSDYKSDRIDLSEKHNYKGVFNYTYNTIIPNIIDNYENISSILIDKVEADDIIACICNYNKIHNPEKSIYIISADKDFLQLGRENIIFYNYKLKKPLILTEEEALLELNKKILLGDKSDGISGIFPKGFKTKLKNELLLNNNNLIEFLEKNNDIKLKYLYNQSLIDFNFIPIKYQKEIIKKIL